jgi:hypothetical protein
MVSFMGLSFDRKRGGAWMRGWKNWALSVARASLPTVLDVRLCFSHGTGLPGGLEKSLLARS